MDAFVWNWVDLQGYWKTECYRWEVYRVLVMKYASRDDHGDRQDHDDPDGRDRAFPLIIIYTQVE